MTREELEFCIQRYGSDIFSFCSYLAGNVEDRDDLYQDTFLLALQKKEQIDPDQNVKSYLLSLSIGIWKNMCRKRKFRQMFHCTLHQFLTRLRIQKAAGKIRMTGVGYANIAVTCGFPSLRSMNHYMKSLTGFSPAEIRALSERDYQDLLERL